MTQGRGSEGELANGVGSQYSSHYLGTWCIQHYYRWWHTPRLPVVDWTDAPVDLSGLVRFAERRNLVYARVPSHFKRSLQREGSQDFYSPSNGHTVSICRVTELGSGGWQFRHLEDGNSTFTPKSRINLTAQHDAINRKNITWQPAAEVSKPSWHCIEKKKKKKKAMLGRWHILKCVSLECDIEW